MGDRLEDRIRDFLVAHLDMLERGLTVLDANVPVRNPSGADGIIDIVARDRFGHFVVIEIKRSDKAAREAPHEILKYVALFRHVLLLDGSHVRVMVVSTDWHELLVPLSEYADASSCLVEGFSIKAEADGTITRADRQVLIPRTGGINISRQQAIYLFETGTARDAALPLLSDSVRAAGVKDFIVLTLDYAGNHSGIRYRYGLYLVFSSPLTTLPAPEVSALKDAIEWDHEVDPDENFLVAINRDVSNVTDAIEIGFPEKLTTIRGSWRTTICLRTGRLAVPPSPLSDDELLALSQAVAGGSSAYFYKLSSPKFPVEWRNLRRDTATVLLGMPHWVAVVADVLDEVEKTDPGATVSMAIYNPTNLLMSLYSVARSMDFSHCPKLEVVVERNTRPEVTVLLSTLMWSGTVVTDTPEALVQRLYGGIDDWLMAAQFNSTFATEAAALQAHELLAPVVEFHCINKGQLAPELCMSDGSGVQRAPFQSERFLSIVEFANANRMYLASLKELLESHIGGLDSGG